MPFHWRRRLHLTALRISTSRCHVHARDSLWERTPMLPWRTHCNRSPQPTFHLPTNTTPYSCCRIRLLLSTP
ncbi:hypothetical protein V8C42DRAFT_40096 [Trichoderma barbatum]